MSKITNQIFGKFYDKEIVLTTLSDKNTSVSIMNWGATIQNWTVYNSTEKQSSVVLGFENFDLYPKFSPFFGSIVGRVINRINKGSFELNGTRHQLDINRPPNHLHGGINSFGKSIWNFETDEKNNNLNTTAAQLFNPANNLNLNLWTDQPGIQVYNAYKLDLSEKGLNGLIYKNFAGICLEDQKFPDSVNHSHFPSIISSPEKPYLHQSIIEIL